MKPIIGCFAIYEQSEEDWDSAEQQLEDFCKSLEDKGMKTVCAPEPVTGEESCKRIMGFFAGSDIDLLCPLIITWCHDHHIWILQKELKVPVAIRALPGLRNGSALGAQQIGCTLGDLDIEHKLFYGEANDSIEAEKLAVYARACAVKKGLSRAKIAMIGRRTPGMTPTAFDELEVMRIFGCQIVTYGMDEITELAMSLNEECALCEWEALKKRAASVSEVVENEGILSMRYYLAIKKIIRDGGYDAVTIGCYPNYCGKTCIPISMLIDEGIPAGCEGDLNSTIAMYVISMLSGKPVHFGEMCVVNMEENYILSSHCGAAPASMACEDGFILTPVRLANTGASIRYRSKPGRVTYVNLVGRKNKYRLCSFCGQAVDTPLVYQGNPMKIVPDTSVSRIWDVIDENSLGHHWMAVYADISKELKEFCRLTGIQGIFPECKELKD